MSQDGSQSREMMPQVTLHTSGQLVSADGIPVYLWETLKMPRIFSNTDFSPDGQEWLGKCPR